LSFIDYSPWETARELTDSKYFSLFSAIGESGTLLPVKNTGKNNRRSRIKLEDVPRFEAVYLVERAQTIRAWLKLKLDWLRSEN